MIRRYRLASKLSQEEHEENTRISTFKKIVNALNITDEEIIKFIRNR